MIGFILLVAVLALIALCCVVGAFVSGRWLYRLLTGRRASREVSASDADSSDSPSDGEQVAISDLPEPCPPENRTDRTEDPADELATADIEPDALSIPAARSGGSMPDKPSLSPADPVPSSSSRVLSSLSARGDVPDIMRSPLARFALVAGIALVLLVPLGLVGSIVDERAGLYGDVVEDISRTWGGRQTLSGPFLLIPYTEHQLTTRRVRDEAKSSADRDAYKEIKESHVVVNYMVVLPATVDFTGVIQPEERQRGIYRSLVYTADVTMRGRFALPTADALERVAPALVDVDYARSFVVMGLSHPNALRKVSPLLWNDAPLSAEPGTRPFPVLDNGFRVPVRLSAGVREYMFSQTMTLSGSRGLRFAPVGETTSIRLSSPWPHPSFQGNVLPALREVTADGFTAEWNIPSLARSYANLGTLDNWPATYKDFPAGVDLYETSAHYQLVERSVKYGILFIGLTFLAFVVFELGLRARLHPVQYGLVGLSMVVFYLVLLSLSEHMAFGVSYAAASACTILMIAVYAAAALRSPGQGAGIGLLLAALYILLYAILQMEDYALLMGTALVLIMLGALMVVSRKLAYEAE